MTSEPEYLGDGVYAIDDRHGVWLHANDHADPTDRIFLEPCVLAALNRFVEKCRSSDNDMGQARTRAGSADWETNMEEHPKVWARLDDDGRLLYIAFSVPPPERPLVFNLPSSKPLDKVEVHIVPVEDYKYLILCRDELEATRKSAKGL